MTLPRNFEFAEEDYQDRPQTQDEWDLLDVTSELSEFNDEPESLAYQLAGLRFEVVAIRAELAAEQARKEWAMKGNHEVIRDGNHGFFAEWPSGFTQNFSTPDEAIDAAIAAEE